jgi:predicted Zn-dependent peptidase
MIINIKPKTGLSGFYVVFKGSTNLEKSGNYGVSHLLEHLLCKSYDDLSEEFDRDGIEDNAYTSASEIVFYIKGLDDKVLKWREVFLERLLNFDVDKKDFTKEKLIVLEEYSDTFNSQESSHVLNLERKLFSRYNPIGLREDLENLNFLDCIKFFELQYLKPSLIINVSSKDFKNSDVVFESETVLTNYRFDPKVDFKYESGNDFKDKTSINILTKIIDSDFIDLRFLNNMLSFGLKSPLYQEIREKNGMAYWVSSHISKWSDNQGIGYISTSTLNKNVDSIIKSIEGITKNPEKYLTKERFKIVKESLLVRKRKSEILRHDNINYILWGEDWDLESNLESMKYSNILDIFKKYYKFSDLYISIDKKEFR